jgi:hypothetical protein
MAGFGVVGSGVERSYGDGWSFKKQQLLSVIVSKLPAARAELGMTPNEKLSWEYKGWDAGMIKMANYILGKYAGKLPPRASDNRSKWQTV